MSSETKDINTQNSEIFKLLGDVSKQNSDSIIKQTESITKLGEGQETIVKTLGEISETIKNGVSSSDNNNPTGPGVGLELNVKPSSDKDVGGKVKIPNVVAPDEHGVQGNPEAGKDKGGLSMEAKKEFELKLKAEEDEKKEYEDYKEKKKTEEDEKKTHAEAEEKKKTEEDEKKTHAEAEEKKKTEEDEKKNKYKAFDYTDNEPLRPTVMTKSFDKYPNGYQIIKAALEKGWGIDGIDAEGSYVETLKRLDNGEFGTFGQTDTGGSYY